MIFGPPENVSLKFNSYLIEHFDKYKYLGCVIKKHTTADPFKLDFTRLCDQAHKTIFES